MYTTAPSSRYHDTGRRTHLSPLSAQRFFPTHEHDKKGKNQKKECDGKRWKGPAGSRQLRRVLLSVAFLSKRTENPFCGDQARVDQSNPIEEILPLRGGGHSICHTFLPTLGHVRRGVYYNSRGSRDRFVGWLVGWLVRWSESGSVRSVRLAGRDDRLNV